MDALSENLIDPAPVFSLDPAKVGAQLILVPAQMAMLGHASPQSTLRYGSDDTAGPEAEFVRDMFVLPPNEVIEKWYGSRLNAARLTAVAVAFAIPGE